MPSVANEFSTTRPRGRLVAEALLALSTALVVAGICLTHGSEMFSPGPLNAQNRSQRELRGVSSHAQLSQNCAACHAAPWSSQSMADLCLQCHDNIQTQIAASAPLHGRISSVFRCASCHVEHQGPESRLTDLSNFDHSATAFPLTGRHLVIRCQSCHVHDAYRGTPQTCFACHAEPQVHLGRFGTECAQCHSTETWKRPEFAHSFPLNHGRGKNGRSECSVCHQEPRDLRVYTCYGCHRHDPEKTESKHERKGILDIQHCARCHPNGKGPRKDGAVGPRS